jgi:hypothetical protein
MEDRLNVWETFDRVWRSVFRALWRLPLLVIGSLLLYVLLSAFWYHYMPVHISGHLAAQAGYRLLHALVFAPLILTVMAQIIDERAGKDVTWSAAIVPVALVLFAWEILALLLEMLPQIVRAGWLGIESENFYLHGHHMWAFLLFAAPYWIMLAATFLFSVRLILIWPILACAPPDKIALSRAWREMRGHFLFALGVSFLALLPLMVTDVFVERLYRSLEMQNNLPVQLSLPAWEGLLVYGADRTLRYVLYAALAAWLYRAIAARRTPASIAMGSENERLYPGRIN